MDIYDNEDFVKKVNKQRNYLAHKHNDNKNSVIKKDEYVYFIAILKMIFECNFLKVLGFEEKQRIQMIKRNYSYNNQKKNIKKLKLL